MLKLQLMLLSDYIMTNIRFGKTADMLLCSAELKVIKSLASVTELVSNRQGLEPIISEHEWCL